jgi:hypothetical protein
MHLKGQLHIHTTCSDGSLAPQEIADIYARMGFDFLAFTDHDHLLRPSYLRALASVRSELLIFAGVELTVQTRKGYLHVSRIEGEREVLHIFNHPADCGLPFRETLLCIADVAERYPLDAVEATSHGFHTQGRGGRRPRPVGMRPGMDRTRLRQGEGCHPDGDPGGPFSKRLCRLDAPRPRPSDAKGSDPLRLDNKFSKIIQRGHK